MQLSSCNGAGKLISDLGSATWKHRNAAVEQVEGIIKAAGNRIQTSTGGLLPALKVLTAPISWVNISRAEPHSQAHKIWDPSFSMCSRASAVLWLRRE